jgi:GT2 family glycosyltransferase
MLNADKPKAEISGSSETASEPIPDVSVVIVSWNVAALLADCLDSLVRCSDGLAIDVWVVDNASSDDSVEMVRTRYPWVHLIANQDNRGFAQANNQAFCLAPGRFILILNPDTIVRDGAIRTLFQFLADHDDVGMVGPYQVDGRGETDIAAARRFLNLGTVFWIQMLNVDALPWIGPWTLRRLAAPYDFSITQEVEAISGAAMLVRREVVRDMKGFGETFHHFGEDLAFCFRIRAAGWKIYYHADATIVHLKKQSSRQAPLRCHIEVALSEEEYFARCYGRFHGWLYRFILQGILVPKILAMGCLKHLFGMESGHQWKQRLQLVRCLLRWQSLDSQGAAQPLDNDCDLEIRTS